MRKNIFKMLCNGIWIVFLFSFFLCPFDYVCPQEREATDKFLAETGQNSEDIGYYKQYLTNVLRDLEKAGQKNQEHQDTIEFLEKTIQFLQEEKDGLLAGQSKLKEELVIQQKSMGEYRTSLNNFLNEWKKAKQQKKDDDAVMEDLRMSVRELIKEKGRLIFEQEKDVKTIQKLNKDIEKNSQAFDAIKKRLEDKDTELTITNKNFNQAVVQKDQYKAKIDDLEKLNEQSSSQTVQFQEQLEKQAKEYETIVAERKVSLNSKDEELKTTRMEKDNLALKDEELEKTVKSLQEQKLSLEKGRDKEKTQLKEEYNKEADRFKKSLEEYKVSLAKVMRQLEDAQSKKEEYKQTSAQLVKTEAENIRLKDSLDKQERNSNQLIARISNLEEEKNTARQELVQKKDAIDKLKIERNNYQQLMDKEKTQLKEQFEKETSRLKKSLEEYKVSLEKEKEELKKVQIRKKAKETNKEELEQALAALRKESGSGKQEIIRLEEKLKNISAELTKAQTQARSAQEEISGKENILQEKEVKFTKVEEEYNDKIKNLERQITDESQRLEQEKIQLKSQLEKAQAENKEYAAAKAEAEKAKEVLEEEIGSLHKERDSRVKNIEGLNRMIGDFEQERQDNSVKIGSLQEEIEKQKGSLSSEKARIEDSFMKDKQGLENKINENQASLAGALNALEETNLKNSEYMEKLKQAEEKVRILNEEKENWRLNKDQDKSQSERQFEGEKTNLEKVVEEYKNSLKKTEEELKIAQSREKERQIIEEQMKQAMNALEDKHAALLKEKDILSGNSEDKDKMINNLEDKKKQYSAKITGLEKELAEYKELLAQRESHFDGRFMNEIKASKETISKLKSSLSDSSHELKQARLTKEELELKEKQLTKVVQSLQKQNVYLQKDRDKLGKDLNAQTALLRESAVNNKETQLVKAVESLQKDNSLLQKDRDMLDENIKDMEKTLAVLKEEQLRKLKESDLEKQQDFKRIGELEDEVNKYKAILAQREIELKQQFQEEAMKENNTTREEANTLKREKEELTKQIEELKVSLNNVLNNLKISETKNEEAQHLLKRIESLESDKELLRQEKQSLDKSSEQLRGELASLKQEQQRILSESEKERNSDTVKIDGLHTEIDRYKILLTQREVEVEENVQKEVDADKMEIGQLKDRIKEKDASIDNVSRQFQEEQRRNSEYRDKLISLENTLQYLKLGYETLEKDKKDLGMKEGQNLKELFSLREENKKLKDTLAQKTSGSQEEADIFSGTIQSLKNKILDLEKEKEVQQELFSKRTRTFYGFGERLKKVEDEKRNYISQVEDLQTEVKEYKNIVTQLQLERDKEQEIVVKKTKDLMENERQAYLDKVDQLQNEIQKYKTALTSVQAQLEEEIKKNTQDFSAKIEEYRTSLNDTMGKLKEAQSQSQIYLSKTSELEKTIEFLRVGYDFMKKEKETLEAKERFRLGEMISLKKENSYLKNIISQTKTMFESTEQFSGSSESESVERGKKLRPVQPKY